MQQQQPQTHVQPSPSNQPERGVADISVAADETREDLKETGRNLRNRLRDLANQVALPSSQPADEALTRSSTVHHVPTKGTKPIMTTRFTNHVSLPEDTKTALVETLNMALATTNDLHSQVKQAHWNIKGPQFFARHELFDTMAGRLRDFADVIAERATTLGGYANGTSRLSAAGSKLPEYDLRAVDGKHHIKVLVDRFSEYTAFVREAIQQAADKKDPATEDLFTEILRGTELDMWFLESHLNV